MKNRKSVSGNRGDLAIWVLIISGFFALVDVTYHLNIRGKTTLYFSLVYILPIILIFIVCELKSDPKIKLKNISKISAVVYSLGFFDRDWWTVIPLFAVFVLLLYSKEGIDHSAQEELTEIKMPSFSQEKWRRTKSLIVIWLVMLYSLFVISDALESCGWISKISLYFFPEDLLEFYRVWFSKGLIRLCILEIIYILGKKYLLKFKPVDTLIELYKEVARTNETEFKRNTKKHQIQKNARCKYR